MEKISKAITILDSGGVVVCPTDTVYGFLADATNKKTVNKIYKIKKRPKSKPLPIFVRDLQMAKELAEIDEKQEKVIKKHWPGKYTFVLKRKLGVTLYGVDKKTIAIRIPKYKILNDLLEKINKPLVQTSVNISDEPPLTNIKDIIEKFGKNKLVDLIIDVGNLKNPSKHSGQDSKPSKIIDLTDSKIKILR